MTLKIIELIKEILIGLLTDITKVRVVTQSEMYDSTYFTNLHPKEYSQEFHYYPFPLKIDSVGSCNTLNDLSNKICPLNKTDDLNLSMFNMIAGINESKIFNKMN